MPARLPEPASKHDIRLYDADRDFLRPYLRARNSDLNEFTRRAVRLAANAKRKELGLPTLPDH